MDAPEPIIEDPASMALEVVPALDPSLCSRNTVRAQDSGILQPEEKIAYSEAEVQGHEANSSVLRRREICGTVRGEIGFTRNNQCFYKNLLD